jgi:hypothetical protein
MEQKVIIRLPGWLLTGGVEGNKAYESAAIQFENLPLEDKKLRLRTQFTLQLKFRVEFSTTISRYRVFVPVQEIPTLESDMLAKYFTRFDWSCRET